MESEKRVLAQLREALDEYRQKVRYGKYPERLRQQARQYALGRRREGASLEVIATELGVSAGVAASWSADGKSLGGPHLNAMTRTSKLPFLPVVIKPEAPSATGARFEVAFADGTRLRAFDISTDTLMEAVRALRRQS